MSRSYKKNPYISNNSGVYKKIGHRICRRRIKTMDVLPSRGTYNKCFESWYIKDYAPRWSKEDAIAYYNRHCSEHAKKVFGNYYFAPTDRYESLENFLNYWAKCAWRK